MNVRPPCRDDLDAVHALMRAHDTAGRGGSGWTRADLAEQWGGLDVRNGEWGWVQTLGVRPAWCRRGIREVLLRSAFRAFFDHGESTVALQVDAQSPTGATRLYERAGMRVLYRIVVWEKILGE